MNDPQRHHLLDQIAAEAIPDDFDRSEEILTHLKEESMSQKHFIHVLARVAVALFALLAMSTAAYAVYQSVSYDPGIQGARDSGFITPVDQTVTIGDASVTLNWAYADPLRLAVNFTAQGIDPNANYGLFSHRGVVLSTGDNFEFFYGSGYSDETPTGDTEWTLEFYPQAVQSTGDGPEDYVLWNDFFYSYFDTLPETLPMNLSLTFGGEPEIPLQPGMQPVPEIGPFVFAFDVNLQTSEAKMFDVNQTVTVKDIEITLKRVQIQASQTDVTLCFKHPSPVDDGWMIRDTSIRLGEIEGMFRGFGLVGDENSPLTGERCYDFRYSIFNDGTSNELIVTVDSFEQFLREGEAQNYEAIAEILREQGIDAQATFSQEENGGGAGIQITDAPEGIDVSEAFRKAQAAVLEQSGRLIRGPWEFVVSIP